MELTVIASENPDLNLIAVSVWSNVRGMFFLNFALTSDTAVIMSVCAETSSGTVYEIVGRHRHTVVPSDFISVVKFKFSGEYA